MAAVRLSVNIRGAPRQVRVLGRTVLVLGKLTDIWGETHQNNGMYITCRVDMFELG